eukprot:9095403-Ditylum_brightwellii.AAC.1
MQQIPSHPVPKPTDYYVEQPPITQKQSHNNDCTPEHSLPVGTSSAQPGHPQTQRFMFRYLQ